MSISKLVPKGRVLALATDSAGGYQAVQRFDDRLDSIILYNLSGSTIQVSFESVSQLIPLAASASLNFDTWDLAATEILKVAFTATASVSVNMTWIEGEGIGFSWLRMLKLGRK